MVKSSRVGNAIIWSAIDVLVRYGLNFTVIIVLARILSPEDFGLVAMLAFFVAAAKLLVDSGFSQALIQRQNTTPTDESTIFFFTLVMGTLVSLILCALAPWIAKFYGQPLLEQMTYWMALNLFLNAFSTIHVTLLTKALDFKTLMKSGGVAGAVSGCVAILMAMWGWGVWSLIGQVLTMTIVSFITLWLLHPWRPKLVFSVGSLRSFFNFGGFLLLTGFLNTLHKNLYALLIGKMHSVQDVGFYSQAHRLQQLPVTIMTSIVGRVAFTAFAEAAEEKVKLVSGMRKALTTVMFVNIPMMLGLMLLAEPLLLTLLGAKWLPSVPVLQVLTVVGLMWPFNVLNINILKAQGHSALNARIQLIKLSVSITLLLLTSPYGILAIAYGQAVAACLGFFVNAYYTKKLLNYGAFAQLRDIVPYFSASLVMILCVQLTNHFLRLPSHFELIVGALAGGCIYLLICKVAKLGASEVLYSMLRNN